MLVKAMLLVVSSHWGFPREGFVPKMRQDKQLQGFGGLAQVTPGTLCKKELGLADWDGEKPFLFRISFSEIHRGILYSCWQQRCTVAKKDRNCSVYCTELCIIYVSFSCIA